MGNKVLMYHQKMMVNRKTRLVVGSQEIRNILIIEEDRFISPSENSPLNSLVSSIHLADIISGDNIEKVLFYKDHYRHSIAVMNDSIINLFETGINVYVSNCGLIILWGEHDIYSTVDMQELNFHLAFDNFLKNYNIKDIFSKDYKDFMRLESRKNKSIIEVPFSTEIDLKSNCSAKIILPKYLL